MVEVVMVVEGVLGVEGVFVVVEVAELAIVVVVFVFCNSSSIDVAKSVFLRWIARWKLFTIILEVFASCFLVGLEAESETEAIGKLNLVAETEAEAEAIVKVGAEGIDHVIDWVGLFDDTIDESIMDIDLLSINFEWVDMQLVACKSVIVFILFIWRKIDRKDLQNTAPLWKLILASIPRNLYLYLLTKDNCEERDI